MPLLLRNVAEFSADVSKGSVEKIIEALVKANLVEARHLEKVFSTGVGKVVAVILETPLGVEGTACCHGGGRLCASFASCSKPSCETPRREPSRLPGPLGRKGEEEMHAAAGPCGRNHGGDFRKPLLGEGAEKVFRGEEAANVVGQSSCGHSADGRGPCSY